MSLEAWGDEGNIVDEPSFNAGYNSAMENIVDAIDKEKNILLLDLKKVSEMVRIKECSELREAQTRLLQGMTALDNIKKITYE